MEQIKKPQQLLRLFYLYKYLIFLKKLSVAPTGIEPVSEEPESSILSIKLRSHLLHQEKIPNVMWHQSYRK